MPDVIHIDIFLPSILSLALPVTQEQKDAVRRILDRACSDSRFAEKAYAAIEYVLTSGPQS